MDLLPNLRLDLSEVDNNSKHWLGIQTNINIYF